MLQLLLCCLLLTRPRLVGSSARQAAASDVLFHVVILMGSGAGDAAATGAAAAKARAVGGVSAASVAAGKDKERLVGVARLNLLDLLERGSDLTSLPPLPLFSKLVGSQPLTNEAAAAASSAAAAAAVAVAAPVAEAQAAAAASATAVAAAEKGGQLGTLAVGTHLIHALQIAQRQLKARNSHVTLRAAPTVPPITSAAAAAASHRGAPRLHRGSSSTHSSYGGAFPSFPATGTGPSTGGGIRGSGGLSSGAAGQSPALREASLASSVGRGAAVSLQSAPTATTPPFQGGSGVERPPSPMQRSSLYKAKVMQLEATSTSQGRLARQQRASRFPLHLGSEHPISSSGANLPGLNAPGESVGSGARQHAGIVGDLEDGDW